MDSLNSNDEENQDTSLTAKIDGNMEVDQEQIDGPPWAELPFPAVEKIYSYLNREDQKSMSLVCRNWHQEYSSPSLWRRLKFCLSCPENSVEICNDVKFARTFGAMLRHVEIVFDLRIHLDFDQIDHISRQLKLFLETVSHHSRLISISFANMEYYFENLEEEENYEDVYHAISNFLKSQNKLQYVEFSKSQFIEAEESAEILKIILTNNCQTLRHMILPGFLSGYDEPAEISVDDDLNFQALMNLQVWKMDYSRTFEKMVLSFHEYRNRVDLREKKGRLKEMELFFHGGDESNYLTIPPVVWNYFRKVFPNLRINLTFRSAIELRNINIFIVPRMPVRALVFARNLRVQTEEFGSLLRHISSCDINMSLKILKVVWLQNSSNLAPDLISFTNDCPKLEMIDLYLKHPVDALDTVFNSWLENRPTSLDIVQITILEVETAEEAMSYESLKDFYAPLLHSLELSLLLFVD